MKNIILATLLSLSSHLHATGPQDIVIKSRMDQQSSASLIGEIRSTLINNQLGDPYNQSFPKTLVVDFTQVLEDLPVDTQSWLKEFQSLLSLKLFESSYKLKVETFSYSITHFSSELRPAPEGLSRIDYVSLNAVQGLKLSAERILFEIELQRTQSGTPIKFDVELIRPEFIVHPDLMLELPMGWHSSLLPDSLMVSLHTIDLTQIFSKIVANPNLVNLQIRDMIIPKVALRVGNREMSFDREKIKNFLDDRKDDMKMAVIDLLRTRMQERFSNIIRDMPQEVFLPRHYALTAAVSPVFELKSMDAVKDSKMLEANIDGHFCANANDVRLNLCRTNELETKIRRVISPEIFTQSMNDIDELFTIKNANLAVSISEHYLNQGIEAAAVAGLLDLAGEDFSLGSEKAFVLAEDKGESFNLYIDIIYKLSRSERILTGRSELHFPVRLGIGIKIINIDGYPRFQIKVLSMKTDNKLLVRGIPEYGLTTNVNSVRFQGKVLKKIAERLSPFNNKILVDIELKEFKDTSLEQLNFFSDGKGRATATLSLMGDK